MILFYACDVTLSAYPHRESFKNMPGYGGIEPTTFGILAQCCANRATRSGRFEYVIFRNVIFCLVPSMSMQSGNIFFCVGVMYSGEYAVCGVPLILFVCVGLNTFHRKIIGNIEINFLLMKRTLYLCQRLTGGPFTTFACITSALYTLIKNDSFSGLGVLSS